MRPLIDYHIHTTLSIDGKLSMHEACQEAIQCGLSEIAFADHFDCDPHDHGFGFFRPDSYMADVTLCKETFADRLTIRAGLEVGEPHLYGNELLEVLQGREFDLVIGAIHWVGGESPTTRDYFVGKDEKTALEPYFAKVYEMASSGNFDVLAHVDLPKRKGTDFYGPFDPKRYEEVIRATLSEIIDKGIALEVNSSGMRSPAAELCPGLQIIRWYREMGGELVTICSDAHRPGNVGEGIEDALRLVYEAGITAICTFIRRKPQIKDIQA